MANKNDVKRKVIELQANGSILGAEKARLQAKISDIKAALKQVKQGHASFQQLVANKAELIARTQQIDVEISNNKDAIRINQQLILELEEGEPKDNTLLITELTELRDRMQKQASDRTRIKQYQLAYSDLAKELTIILKKHK